MDRLFQDLRIAVRALLRQRSFSLVAVLTLALGIGATTAIFSVVNGILLRPLPYVESDRIVTLGSTAKSNPQDPVDGSSSHVNFLDWKRESKTIRPMAMYSDSRATITSHGDVTVVPIGSVTTDFFGVFKATPMLGREFTAEETSPSGPRAIVIGYGFWQERLGGRPDVLGQTVEISSVPWPIVGVAPQGFDFPSGARLWMPVRNDDQNCGRGCVYLNGIGRLADGATPAAAQQEMTSIAAALERDFPNDNYDNTVMVQTLHDKTVGNVRLALIVLLAAVGMVLLIACANVANLVLVRGAKRTSEIAVRTALGSGRRGVVTYLLTENLVLALAGGLLGLVFTLWGIDALKLVAPQNLPRLDEVRFDLPTFLFALTMVVATTLLFGLAPSLRLSRVSLSQALGQRGTVGATSRRWTKSMLLVAEVGLSLMLLLGAGLLLRSLSALQDIDLGFNAEGITVFMISLPASRYPDAASVVQTHEGLDEQIGALPGVSRVARISGLPLGPSENVFTFNRPDQPPPPPGQFPIALFRVVDPEYFETMGIRILAGRAFDQTDRQGAQPVVIISKRMADLFWPGENPVGRPISVSRQPPAIVAGVVADVRSQQMATMAQPEMYLPHAQSPSRSVMYVVKSALETGHVITAARQLVQAADSRLPLISPSSMQDLVDQHLARPRFYLLLISLFAVLAIVLTAVGIYGVVAYAVSQRTREIGVRMALGARQREVITLMLWHGLKPALIGVVAGLTMAGAAVAYASSAIIDQLLFQIRPGDPMTIAISTVVLLTIVVLACAIPARRASTVPPADALRSE